MSTEWLTIAEAAARLEKSERTIQRWAKDGKVPARLVDGHGGNGRIWVVKLNDKISISDTAPKSINDSVSASNKAVAEILLNKTDEPNPSNQLIVTDDTIDSGDRQYYLPGSLTLTIDGQKYCPVQLVPLATVTQQQGLGKCADCGLAPCKGVLTADKPLCAADMLGHGLSYDITLKELSLTGCSWASTAQAAAALNTTRRAVNLKIDNGDLAAVRIPGRGRNGYKHLVLMPPVKAGKYDFEHYLQEVAPIFAEIGKLLSNGWPLFLDAKAAEQHTDTKTDISLVWNSRTGQIGAIKGPQNLGATVARKQNPKIGATDQIEFTQFDNVIVAGMAERTLKRWIAEGKVGAVPDPDDARKRLVKVADLPKEVQDKLPHGPQASQQLAQAEQLIKLFKQFDKTSRPERPRLIATWVQQGLISSSPTFYRKLKAWRSKGLAGLRKNTRADKDKRRKPLPKPLVDMFVSAVLARPEYCIATAMAKVNAALTSQEQLTELSGLNPDEIRELTRYDCDQIAATCPLKDAHTRKWFPSRGRTNLPSVHHKRLINPPNTIWQVDDHDQDVLVYYRGRRADLFRDVVLGYEEYADKRTGELKKRAVRPKALKVIDPETGMILGYELTDDNYGATEIKKALIMAFKAYGVPRQVYLECDKRMREAGMLRMLDKLGIELYGTPYNPTAKVNVEKSFDADRRELDAGYDSYIGNRPANRPEHAENRIKLSMDEYRADYAKFVEKWNSDRRMRCGAERLTGPQIWRRWEKRGWKPTILPAAQQNRLGVWAAAPEELTVRGGMVKKTIAGEGFYYTGEPLMSVPDGAVVTIYRDITNLELAACEWQGRFIGDLRILTGTGYGYGELTDQAQIEYVLKLRKAKARKLAGLAEEVEYANAWLNSLQPSDNPPDKLEIHAGVYKVLFEHKKDAAEIAAELQEQELKEAMNADYSSDPMDDYDAQIAKILGGDND